jgi:hypothetical protein
VSTLVVVDKSIGAYKQSLKIFCTKLGEV